MSGDWEDLFPLVNVRNLVRDLSDHNPMLLSSGEVAMPLKIRAPLGLSFGP